MILPKSIRRPTRPRKLQAFCFLVSVPSLQIREREREREREQWSHWISCSGSREKMRTAPPPLVLLLLVHGLASAASAAFTCNATGVAATCRSLVGFNPAQNTTYGAIASLFQVSNASLFGSNGLSLTTPADGAVAAGSTVRVPIPCRCANGTGWSDRTPVYTVQDGDVGLYNITVARFSNLTTYQDIGTANQLPDVNKIQVGQNLSIPLPCSCDEVDGAEVVHLAHVVAPGSSVEGIAMEFGTNASTLLRLNGMSDPKALAAYQVLDVPLRACSSSITNNSLDYGLRLASGSYATTANGCITCSCTATTYRLDCHQSVGQSKCPAAATCPGKLFIGNTSTSGCEVQTCSYAGYTNTSAATSINISSTITTDRTNCGSDGGSPPGSDGGLGLRGFKWSAALVFLHMIWLSSLQ